MLMCNERSKYCLYKRLHYALFIIPLCMCFNIHHLFSHDVPLLFKHTRFNIFSSSSSHDFRFIHNLIFICESFHKILFVVVVHLDKALHIIFFFFTSGFWYFISFPQWFFIHDSFHSQKILYAWLISFLQMIPSVWFFYLYVFFHPLFIFTYDCFAWFFYLFIFFQIQVFLYFISNHCVIFTQEFVFTRFFAVIVQTINHTVC